MSDNIPLTMNDKRIKSTKSTQKPKKHKPEPFVSGDKPRRKKQNDKPSYTSVKDRIKGCESDEKALADVAVDVDDVAGEDVEETAREKRKRVAEAYLEKIPFDIQEEIIKILPIKSLVRFRLVSKQWKSLIDSSKFIAKYHTHQKLKHHLLVTYRALGYSDRVEYDSIIDDDTFPQHKFSLTIPKSVNILWVSRIVSSQGLLFVRGNDKRSGTSKAYIWNPTIRKSVNIDMRDMRGVNSLFGFGVCPDTCDPMIVRLPYNGDSYNINQDTTFEVFTLSTNAWRRPSKNNLPRKCISFTQYTYQVAIDRFMYWLAREPIDEYDVYLERQYMQNLIVSFDMTSEEFTEISFPASLAVRSTLNLYNIRDSLVVVQIKHEGNWPGEPVYSVWKMMEQGVSKSFTKLYTINTTDVICHVNGFRKSGEPIAYTVNNPRRDLVAYDPDSKHIIYIGVPGTQHFSVNSYIETLLLLDHRDCSTNFDMD